MFNQRTSPKVLAKLEWPLLVAKLAQEAQTEEGQDRLSGLTPDLDRNQVEDRWSHVVPLRDIARSGYKAPVGMVRKMHHVFKGADKGMIFEGEDLRLVYDLLVSVKKVAVFIQSFAARSPYLQKIRGQLYALPELYVSIEKTVGSDGDLLDTASTELQVIRKQKVSLRKRIEEQALKILLEPTIAEYLQDNFFTVRNEKYVIPIRLDGRGRIKGTIVDTSDSGQTLLLEPVQLAPMNEQLHELDLAEKLEIIRIFRELSAHVARELESLKVNYTLLVELDVLTAQAALAATFDAGPVKLVDAPTLNLILARHPLILTAEGRKAEPNSISLEKDQKILVVSGPNAGGKTVVLKTVGMLQLMARAGLLVPADERSQMYLFDQIYLEMGDAQNITANLSTFSGHIIGLKPILDEASASSLVLLDELATGTEPNTGAAIARAILEHLVVKGVTAIATTHFDSLKSLALGDKRFRNGSMEYAEATYRPTYRLILDVPGQSYGLEVARQMGLSESIVDRAREIRGSKLSDLDDAVAQLQKARLEADQLRRNLDLEVIAAQQAKSRWEEECRLLEEQRGKATRSVAAKLEDQVGALRSEFEDAARKLKDVVKEVRCGSVDVNEAIDERKRAEEKLKEIDRTISKMSEAGISQDLPGRPVEPSELREKLNVYVIPVKREGTIVKVPVTANDPVEVQVGIVKLRIAIQDLRITRGADPSAGKAPSPKQKSASSGSTKPPVPEFVPQSPTNTLDLRGMDSDSAVEKSLNFIDKALLRGELAVVLIHGHGSDKLKAAIRQMLKSSCPYEVSYRAGAQNEGGDGVTIVGLRA